MTCPHGCCPTYRDHLLSITVAGSAMPTRKVETNATTAREKRWDRDMAAYRRLRRDGQQPPHIDGSAQLEAHAETRAEVTAGTALKTDRQRSQLKEILGDDC